MRFNFIFFVIETQTKRIDHLGIIAGVIKHLNLIDFLDKRLETDPREEISKGEAIAGMIINGLGFSNRPMSLTPQFFDNKALTQLFGKSMDATHFNRFKLGRSLDACYSYGCSKLFAEISAHVCNIQNIDMRFNSLDTTTFSLTGEYEDSSDEHAIKITHGHSKDHRPDLKQAILEIMISQDGGVPTCYMAHNGNKSDCKIFQERSKALLNALKNADFPRYLIADSKLYTKSNLEENLKNIPFITRVPATIKLEQEVISEALISPENSWSRLDDNNKYQATNVNHYGLSQRWIVVFSLSMHERSKKKI